MNFYNRVKEIEFYTVRGATITSDFFVRIEVKAESVMGDQIKKLKLPLLVRSRMAESTEPQHYYDPPYFDSCIQLPAANLDIII